MSNTKHSINHRKTPGPSNKSLLKHLFPDDASRVKLSNVDDDPCSDYINASYIPVSEPLGRWSSAGWPRCRYPSSCVLALFSGPEAHRLKKTMSDCRKTRGVQFDHCEGPFFTMAIVTGDYNELSIHSHRLFSLYSP